MSDLMPIAIDAEPGAVYAYHRGGTYRLLCQATHVHSLQALIVYEGPLEAAPGRQKGFACTLSDWYDKFKRVPEPEPPAEPQPHKVAGHISASVHA